ncbi:hypothetical protein [Catellatospora sp. NPDC049133]|uniref:hypothetical protein n=1 Tax=Catellatospora sp. NPDC049133 TaxID=3155499 RepID=UPI0033D2B6E5
MTTAVGAARRGTSAGAVLQVFYRVPRAGAVRLSDGGGPLGFDITAALQIDHLIGAYDCDGIVETGCFVGDSTEYFARRYPHLPVRTCDIDADATAVASHRLADLTNVTVETGDSAQLLPQLLSGLSRPLVYLDAHWYSSWPLARELHTVTRGLIVVDDFDIGHPRFGYDAYDQVVCGPQLVADARADLDRMWVGNPYADYPLPCLQTGRRAGRGFLTVGLPPGPLDDSPMFTPIPLRPVVMPDWSAVEALGKERR